jgi:hypothetical protein
MGVLTFATYTTSFALRKPALLVYNNLPVLFYITNEMQLYAIFLIIFNALHVSSGFSAHHQELIKLYMQP